LGKNTSGWAVEEARAKPTLELQVEKGAGVNKKYSVLARENRLKSVGNQGGRQPDWKGGFWLRTGRRRSYNWKS